MCIICVCNDSLDRGAAFWMTKLLKWIGTFPKYWVEQGYGA